MVAAILAIGFGSAAYAYLTLPNVRLLRTRNPTTTAFIELREREARARGTHEVLIDESPVYREMYDHGLLEAEFAARVEATA